MLRCISEKAVLKSDISSDLKVLLKYPTKKDQLHYPHSISRDGWKRRKTRNMNVIRIYPFFYFLGGWVDYVIDGNQSFSIPDTLCVSRALHFFLSFPYTIIIFE